MNVKKAVIPVAGLGTRFLPATKTVPKEMLPIVDKPALLYIMEEIVAADISHVVLIAGRGKSAIEDFVDTSYEVEDTLERAGRTELLKPCTRSSRSCAWSAFVSTWPWAWVTRCCAPSRPSAATLSPCCWASRS